MNEHTTRISEKENLPQAKKTRTTSKQDYPNEMCVCSIKDVSGLRENSENREENYGKCNKYMNKIE